LISNIAQPTNKLSLIYQNGMLDIIHPILQKIASIYVGSNPFVAANNLRIALTEGCLTPVISSNYPLDVLEALSTTPLLGMINKLADRNGIQLLNAYQDAQGKPRILKPELLW
jgi:hypothetical protein